MLQAVLPEDYMDTKRVSCGIKSDSFLKHFPYSRETILEIAESENQCKKYCGAKTGCIGCGRQCNENCQWTAVAHCEEKYSLNQTIAMNVSLKPGKLCYFDL